MRIVELIFSIGLSFLFITIVGEAIARKLTDKSKFKIWWRNHWIVEVKDER